MDFRKYFLMLPRRILESRRRSQPRTATHSRRDSHFFPPVRLWHHCPLSSQLPKMIVVGLNPIARSTAMYGQDVPQDAYPCHNPALVTTATPADSANSSHRMTLPDTRLGKIWMKDRMKGRYRWRYVPPFLAPTH